jgi:hypothetical protein
MNIKKVLRVLGLTALLVAVALFAYQAFDEENALAASSGPVGFWKVTVSPEEGPSFVDGIIFSSDGTMTAMEDTGRMGLGAWEKLGKEKYAFSFWEYYQEGEACFQVKVSSTIQLSHGADAYTGSFIFQAYDLDGNLLASGAGTATGVRQHVEPLP